VCGAGDDRLPNYQLPIWVWPTAMMTVWVLAQWRGRDEERLAISGYLAGWALSMVVARATKRDLQDTPWAILPIDVAMLGLFLWIVLRTRRRWPVFAAAAQLLMVATYLVRPAVVDGWTYMTVQMIWSYLALIAIGYGAWTAPRHASPAAATPRDVPGATRR
jgi:hypothetical protein